MWENIKVNIQNIEAETANALLIKLPNKSKFKDFSFWISKKLVRDGSHSYEISIGIREDFQITAKRTGKNFKVLDEKILTASDIKEAFNG